MKNKLLLILSKLENRDIQGFYYSLTINYVNLVTAYKYELFKLDKVKNIISSSVEIESYNLTIYNYGKYDEKRYEQYYHSVDLVFHSEGLVFNFISNYLINRQLEIVEPDHLFQVYAEHLKCSQKLFEVIRLSQV